MLIRNAEILGVLGKGRCVDVRIAQGRIDAIDASLRPRRDERVIEAGGGALLPGLHDQHLHLRSLAAAQASLVCGAPSLMTAEALQQRLQQASLALPVGEWLRGIGYHESLAGNIDRDWLDRHVPERPLRIQHRGGRCWIFNSAALRALDIDPDNSGDDPLERIGGRATGRLFDADAWLRHRLPRRPVSLHAISLKLARYGVTAVTDATPRNDADEFAAFAAAQAAGELLQDVTMMGEESLDGRPIRAAAGVSRLRVGATKFHLHDADLGDLDEVIEGLRRSHRAGRAAAFHCVTRGELAFALAAIEEAGTLDGDRVEHASVTPPELLEMIVRLRLRVTAQPNFVAERGDRYLDDVDEDDRPWLYRLRSFIQHGVPLSGSTDAPFGDADPWAAMRSAVERRTPDGRSIGADEALTPEQALALFCANQEADLRVGARARLCLLDRPWQVARTRLLAADVRLTLNAEHCLWDREA